MESIVIREAIEAERQRRGLSHWALSKMAADRSGLKHKSVLAAVTREGGFGIDIAEALLAALDLEIRPRRKKS